MLLHALEAIKPRFVTSIDAKNTSSLYLCWQRLGKATPERTLYFYTTVENSRSHVQFVSFYSIKKERYIVYRRGVKVGSQKASSESWGLDTKAAPDKIQKFTGNSTELNKLFAALTKNFSK